jgi:hypothetical protein
MPVYHFNLRDGGAGIPDLEGAERSPSESLNFGPADAFEREVCRQRRNSEGVLNTSPSSTLSLSEGLLSAYS